MRHVLNGIGQMLGLGILALYLLLSFAGCAGSTLETRADAAYGSFVVAEQAAAQAIQSPAISDSVKLKIQKDEAAAKPLSDSLEAAILAYKQSPTAEGQLSQALDAAIAAINTLAAEVPAK